MPTLIELAAQLREYIEQPFTFPGGYPKVLWMADGECLCPACAKDNQRLIEDATEEGFDIQWQVAGVDIHWEGGPLICANCNAEIESAYGVDEEDETC